MKEYIGGAVMVLTLLVVFVFIGAGLNGCATESPSTPIIYPTTIIIPESTYIVPTPKIKNFHKNTNSFDIQ